MLNAHLHESQGALWRFALSYTPGACYHRQLANGFGSLAQNVNLTRVPFGSSSLSSFKLSQASVNGMDKTRDASRSPWIL
jgi:hypothetical protein